MSLVKIKIDKVEAEKLLELKLDRGLFEEVFPRSENPKEYLKYFIKTENLFISKQIDDMLRIWDAKLVKLKGDINIGGLARLLETKAD